MRSHALTRLLIVVMPLSALAVALLWHQQTSASSYYAHALASVHASSTVVADGSSYIVRDGTVYPATDNPFTKKKILALAYAHEAARAHPFLDITGSNPQRLADAVNSLSARVAQLAAAQHSAADRAAVEHLYPLNYLSALAEAESARIQFIYSGDTDSYRIYDRSLTRAFVQGESDARVFAATFSAVAGTSSTQIAYQGGLLSVQGLRASAMDIPAHIRATAKEYDRLRTCIAGFAGSCHVDNLLIPPPEVAELATVSTEEIALASEVQSMRQAAFGVERLNDSRLVALAGSACIRNPPYIFDMGLAPFQPQYTADILFSPVKDTDGPTVSYLRNKEGINYLPLSSTVFYQCPAVARDLSAAIATLTAGTSTQGVWYEAAARAHVRTELSNGIRDGSILQAALIFAHKRAGIDSLVEQIDKVAATDIALVRDGVPFDLSVRTLFLTHSAFPSLFSGFVKLPVTTDAPHQSIPYSSLRAIVPRDVLVGDMRRFIEFEKAF